MRHELGILTNDGWVVTLVSDQRINIDEAIIETIIVQPREDYAKRIAENPAGDGIAREEYVMGRGTRRIETIRRQS